MMVLAKKALKFPLQFTAVIYGILSEDGLTEHNLCYLAGFVHSEVLVPESWGTILRFQSPSFCFHYGNRAVCRDQLLPAL